LKTLGREGFIPIVKQHKTLGQFEKPSEFETKLSGNFKTLLKNRGYRFRKTP